MKRYISHYVNETNLEKQFKVFGHLSIAQYTDIHKYKIIISFSFFFPGQRITTIQLDGVQYFVSRMNPYSPELNYFLAYQYCRSLGLQLASFETKEKVESMSQYLQNAGKLLFFLFKPFHPTDIFS